MHTTTFFTAEKVHRAIGRLTETRSIRGYLSIFDPRQMVICVIHILMLTKMALTLTKLPHKTCDEPSAPTTYDLCHRSKSLHRLNLRAIMSS
jgi:hypothetical protein